MCGWMVCRRTTKLSDDAQHFRICLEKQLGHIYRSQIEEQQRRKLFEGKEQVRTARHSHIPDRWESVVFVCVCASEGADQWLSA